MSYDELFLAKKIIRRKAKRIERAKNKLWHLKIDIETSDINVKTKQYLLKQIDKYILPCLQNDDKEEDMYNYDNANGYKIK